MLEQTCWIVMKDVKSHFNHCGGLVKLVQDLIEIGMWDKANSSTVEVLCSPYKLVYE